jgi:hypothetical protein
VFNLVIKAQHYWTFLIAFMIVKGRVDFFVENTT